MILLFFIIVGHLGIYTFLDLLLEGNHLFIKLIHLVNNGLKEITLRKLLQWNLLCRWLLLLLLLYLLLLVVSHFILFKFIIIIII
jgi:predicted MFS family arabinose efflux permease